MLENIVSRLKIAGWLLTDANYERLTSPKQAQKVNMVSRDHQKVVSDIKLADTWDDENRTVMEIQIAVLRAAMRYNPNSIEMVGEILENYRNSRNRDDKLRYFTLPFPMVHPAGEVPISRAELIHNDQIGAKRLFTIWTPVTNYEYTPLSGFPRYGFVKQYGPPFLRKYFEEKMAIQIDVPLGGSVMWGGGFTHAGNPNTETKLSTALVIRLTEAPIFYEPVRLISEGLDKPLKNEADGLTLDDCANFCREVIERSSSVTEKSELGEIMGLAAELVASTIEKPDQKLSFCLTVLAQRMRKKMNVSLLFAAALYSGSEYLFGIEFLREKFPNLDTKGFVSYLTASDRFGTLPVNSWQFLRLTGSKDIADAPVLSF